MTMPPESAKTYRGIAAILLFVSVALAYIPVYNAGYVWDDDAYVSANPLLKNGAGLKKIWFEPKASPQYYPLVFTTFWLEYRLFGPNPRISHIINVALHLANAFLIGWIFSLLGVRLGWFVAAVFALHPIQAETVAWITERKNVLSGFFYLSTMGHYLRFYLSGGEFKAAAEKFGPRRWKIYGLSLFLFVCALLSKTVTASLPAAVVLILWWKRDRLQWKDIVPLTPFFLLGLAGGLSTAWMEIHHVGAQGAEWNLSLIGRALVAGRAAWFYIGKLLWPHPLIFIYPRWTMDAGRIGLAVWPLAVLALTAFLWTARKKIGKGPLAGLLFFLVTLFPALGFFNVYPFRYSYVADHFQYLASIGIIAVIVSGLWALTGKLKKPHRWMLTVMGLAMMAVLGALTFTASRKYHDLETLWRDTISKNPSSWIAHNNLGNLLASRGEWEEATAHYEAVLSSKPDFAVAHNNLSGVWFRRGNAEKAVWHGQEAVRLDDRYAEAYVNLGAALMKQGRSAEAVSSYSKALDIDPNSVTGHNNLGNALARLGRFKEASQHYLAALNIRSDLPFVHFHLGESLENLGDWEEAIRHYRESIRLKPDFAPAHYRLGLALRRTGRPEEADVFFQNAVRLDPGFGKLIPHLP